MEAFECIVCHKMVEKHEDEAVLCLCLGPTVLGKERYCKKCGRLTLKALETTFRMLAIEEEKRDDIGE